MASVKNFLKQNKLPEETKDVFVSDRFIDENKRPILWKIRALSSYEEKLIDESVKKDKKDKRTGTITTVRDDNEYIARIAAQAVVFPDLGDKELQSSYSTSTKVITTKADLLREMLSAGELLKLGIAVSNLSGLNLDEDDDKKSDYETDLEHAKN